MMLYVVKEDGPWRVAVDEAGKEVYVASNDFTHDFWMQVTGDFACLDDKKAYAAEITRRLNAWRPE